MLGSPHARQQTLDLVTGQHDGQMTATTGSDQPIQLSKLPVEESWSPDPGFTLGWHTCSGASPPLLPYPMSMEAGTDGPSTPVR